VTRKYAGGQASATTFSVSHIDIVFARSCGEVPVVNVHVQTLSEPMAPFVKAVADLTTAAERSMETTMSQLQGNLQALG
jgi:hypothetical protein